MNLLLEIINGNLIIIFNINFINHYIKTYFFFFSFILLNIYIIYRKIQLKLNNDNNYISFNLKSIDVENDNNKHLYVKSLIILRNYYDYSYYYTNGGMYIYIFR